MKATRVLPLALVAGLAGAQTFAAEHLVTVDAAFNNVFFLNGDGTAGGYIYGEVYGDLPRAQIIDIAAGSARMGPNTGYYEDVCINGNQDSFWCGGDGTTPNKFVMLVGDGPVPGQPQFTVTADVSGIPAGYNAQLTALGCNSDCSENYAFPVTQTLTADGTLTAAIDFTGGTLVNYRAQVILNGPIIAPADAASVGYMSVTNFKATYDTPSVPGNVRAFPESNGAVVLAWSQGEVAPASYLVQRDFQLGGGYVTIAEVPWTQTDYQDQTDLQEGERAFYRVVAVGAGQASATSEEVVTQIPVAVEATPVPALPLWGLALLGGLLGLFGYRRLAK